VILEISSKRLGLAAVVTGEDQLIGVITDGDLRRMLEKGGDINAMTAEMIMTRSPRTIEAASLAVDALDLMRKNNITQLPVIENGKYAGVIHLHDLVKRRIDLMNKNHYVAIMAGGIGSRFWPMSRTNYPKQFLDILGTGRTLIQNTYDRFSKFMPAGKYFCSYFFGI
jgi:predicted transcriptional regulator